MKLIEYPCDNCTRRKNTAKTSCMCDDWTAWFREHWRCIRMSGAMLAGQIDTARQAREDSGWRREHDD